MNEIGGSGRMADNTATNRLEVRGRLDAFGIGPVEHELLARIGEEIVGEIDYILEPLRPALEDMRASGNLSKDCDIPKACVDFRSWMVSRLTQPIDEHWMKAAAGVGNWTHENQAVPYRMVAALHHVFSHASQVASSHAADKEDREARMLVLGAIDRMTAELMVARLNRITKHIEETRRAEIAAQFQSSIADAVSAPETGGFDYAAAQEGFSAMPSAFEGLAMGDTGSAMEALLMLEANAPAANATELADAGGALGEAVADLAAEAQVDDVVAHFAANDTGAGFGDAISVPVEGLLDGMIGNDLPFHAVGIAQTDQTDEAALAAASA